MAAPSPTLLTAAGLGVDLAGRAILSDCDLRLAAGSVHAVVGASGSGKTTLLLSLLGLLPAAARVRGRLDWTPRDAPALDLLQLRPAAWRALRGRHIAFIPQEPSAALDPRRTAAQHLRECGGVSQMLDEVGLAAGRADDYPHQWSGGMQQRLLVAMALARHPDLLLADEPTSALDAENQAQLLALLAERVRGRGIAICLVTHDLAVAAQLAEQVSVMTQGRIVERGPCPEVFRRPANPYTASLVACQPVWRRGGAA